MELLSCQGPAKSIDEAAKHKYQFWDTQPVPKLSECLLIIFICYLVYLNYVNVYILGFYTKSMEAMFV